MNSIHDLGGMTGFGPMPFEDNEPVFHEEWERRTFGVNILSLMAGLYTADESRHAMERIPALRWLKSPYYEHWLDGTATLLVEMGIATEEELRTGKATEGVPDWVAKLKAVPAEAVAAIVATNHNKHGQVDHAPLFKKGDRVRTQNIHPKTHTRLPRYIRGHIGTIHEYRGPFFYADKRTIHDPEVACHTYTVRFDGKELWGESAGPKDAVYIEMYETYLIPEQEQADD